MKKTRFLVLVVAAAIMLMGAGYAAWSDQVFAYITARTGNFDMQVTNARIVTDDLDWDTKHENYSFDWTNEVYVDHNANEAIIDFKDLYPGGMVRLDMNIKNCGTIPARLKSINVEFLDGDKNTFNNIQAQTAWGADITGDGKRDIGSIHVGSWKEWKHVTTALEKDLVESIKANNLVIEPGGELWLDGEEGETSCVVFRLNPDAKNETQNKWCKFKITFNWEQWSTTPGEDGYPTYGGDGEDN